MAIKTSHCFTIFTPTLPSYLDPTRPNTTRINFSRWNNANAEKHNFHQRSQEQIERDIRLSKKDELASKFIDQQRSQQNNPTTNLDPSPYFKSIGTPSSPSRSSVPAKFSKYSKSPRNRNPNSNSDSHPAFRVPRVSRVLKTEKQKGIRLGEHGVSYRIRNAPFEFQYSYTETPKVKPLALREPPYVPFGPTTMPRPWTGRAPLKKKVLPEFDSFRLPPANKKGVKPVQAPGPFLPGSGGPRYVKTREEILGEPLTDEEVKSLVQGCLKSTRQLNIGRDGLTHNMLDNIHAHWKRRRVCKIKCKGVCTVDMDNVHQQIEEKTGGKIIYSKGGVLFLFRGRNYNYRTRPRFPLMLWKPVTPVYPRLVKQVPEGLTLEEASEMRKRGRKLPPICKLGKNGVYANLVKHVKEAFEECELVRINCQGMNRSDYKKIGGKLKDLVPCVLISFENEQILMWRGRDWKSSLPTKDDLKLHEGSESTTDSSTADVTSGSSSIADFLHDGPSSDVSVKYISDEKKPEELIDLNSPFDKVSVGSEELGDHTDTGINRSGPEPADTDVVQTGMTLNRLTDGMGRSDELAFMSDGTGYFDDLATVLDRTPNHDIVAPIAEAPVTQVTQGRAGVYIEGVISLRKQAIDGGMALLLDEDCLDANIVYEKAVGLFKTAPAGPVFRDKPRKVLVKKADEQGAEENLTVEVVVASKKRGSEKSASKKRSSEKSVKSHSRKELFADEIPHGSLRVDELAKLLA